LKCVFVQSSVFANDWAALKLDDDDLRELEILIMERGETAPRIRGAGGARKIRFSPSRRRGGKSGAYRVIYGWFPDAAQVHLFLAYGKNEQAELTSEERAACRQLMRQIAAILQTRRE
jgi:hypothetical protein